jgi:hypothetical protein
MEGAHGSPTSPGSPKSTETTTQITAIPAISAITAILDHAAHTDAFFAQELPVYFFFPRDAHGCLHEDGRCGECLGGFSL